MLPMLLQQPDLGMSTGWLPKHFSHFTDGQGEAHTGEYTTLLLLVRGEAPSKSSLLTPRPRVSQILGPSLPEE